MIQAFVIKRWITPLKYLRQGFGFRVLGLVEDFGEWVQVLMFGVCVEGVDLCFLLLSYSFCTQVCCRVQALCIWTASAERLNAKAYDPKSLTQT